jgi:UDP-glucose 6-dehydrogenase
VRDYNENCGGWTWLRRHDCRRLPLHEVIGVDVSDEKVAIVNAGKSPITEPGLDELVARALALGIDYGSGVNPRKLPNTLMQPYVTRAAH